jgi:hypothetical protein
MAKQSLILLVIGSLLLSFLLCPACGNGETPEEEQQQQDNGDNSDGTVTPQENPGNSTDGDGDNGGDSGGITFVTIEVRETSANGATIYWKTSGVARGELEYGTTDSYEIDSVSRTSSTDSHEVTLNSLASGTEYHFRVGWQDRHGNGDWSEDQTFTTMTGAVFDITSVDVSPTEVQFWEPVTVTAQVSNTGDTSGTRSLVLNVDGQEETKSVTVAPGGQETVTFTVTHGLDDIDTTRTVQIEGHGQPETVTVGVPPNVPSWNAGDTFTLHMKADAEITAIPDILAGLLGLEDVIELMVLDITITIGDTEIIDGKEVFPVVFTSPPISDTNPFFLDGSIYMNKKTMIPASGAEMSMVARSPWPDPFNQEEFFVSATMGAEMDIGFDDGEPIPFIYPIQTIQWLLASVTMDMTIESMDPDVLLRYNIMPDNIVETMDAKFQRTTPLGANETSIVEAGEFNDCIEFDMFVNQGDGWIPMGTGMITPSLGLMMTTMEGEYEVKQIGVKMIFEMELVDYTLNNGS